jgi:beta-lactamase regulating signal transducer with metallopeptidase domain
MKVAAELLLTFLLNATWQIALVALFAVACDWLLRGTAARYRHGLWVAALGLAFVLPLLGPARLIKARLTPKSQAIEVAPAPSFVTWTYSPDLDSMAPIAKDNAPAPSTIRAVGNVLAPGIHLNRVTATIVVILYGLFFLFRLGQLMLAWRRTKKIVSGAYECQFDDRVKVIIEKCRTAIGGRRVRFLCSSSVPVPVTVGIVKPLIILPEGLWQNVEDEVLTSAIGHELVHVARRDYLTNLIYELVYLPLSFHPAAVLLRRRIKQTRELCCDEAVTNQLIGAETYARSLVRLIGGASLDRRPAVETTIGISEGDILEVRIMSLLKRSKITPRRKRFLVVMASLLLAAPCVAATGWFSIWTLIDKTQPPLLQNRERPSGASPIRLETR